MQYELEFSFKDCDFKTLKNKFFNRLLAVYQKFIIDNPTYNTKITDNRLNVN